MDFVPRLLAGSSRHRTVSLLAVAVIASTSLSAGAYAADDALIQKGREIADTVAGVGCKGCHGTYGEGDLGIGPYNRGVSLAKLQAAIGGGVKQMEFLRDELTQDDIKAVAEYYAWLGELQLVKTIIKRGRFIPEQVEIYPGQPIQLVINNTTSAPQNFASKENGIAPFTVPERDAVDLVWKAPEKEGTYEIQCVDCRVKDQKLSIVVSKSAPMHRGQPPAPSEVAAVPAAQEAPVDKATLDHGRELFMTAGDVGCIACHGNYAEGDVGIGPYNRGKDEHAIRLALRSVEAMKFLGKELTETQIKQVAAYYAYLGRLKLIKTHVVKGRFFPNSIDVAPGTSVQLVVVNRDATHIKVEGSGMKIAPYSIGGRGEEDRVWVAPETEGTFELKCTDCEIKQDKLTIRVSKAAK